MSPPRPAEADPPPLDAPWPRIILHADMDAFYAAVEQLDRPELRGRPVLVGGPSRRAVVCTASYEARPYGCRSAMPMAEALRRCPQAVVVPPRFERYQEISQRLRTVFDRFSPLVEPLSLDEAFLDLSGAEALFGSPDQMAAQLKQAVFEATGGLTVSVGASTTKFVAKVASDHRKPDGLTVVPPGQVRDFLAPLQVARLWGVGPKTQARLAQLGLHTIGEVAALAEPQLQRQLGSLGVHLAALARGEDPRPVIPDRAAQSVGAEQTLEEDVVGEAAIRPWLRQAAQRVGRALRRDGLVAGGVRLKLRTATFRLLTRQAPLAPPTDSDQQLEHQAAELLAQTDLEEPIRLVGLAAFQLAPATGSGTQQELFPDETRQRQQRLDRTLDDLRNRFGEGVVRRG